MTITEITVCVCPGKLALPGGGCGPKLRFLLVQWNWWWHSNECHSAVRIGYQPVTANPNWLLRKNDTYLLTPWNRVILEKPTGFQLVKIFPAFYGTRRFITAFTSCCHMSISWASSIQSIPSHPSSWRSIFILSSHLRLGLPSGLFPSGFPTKTLHTPLPHTRYVPCPSHSSRFDNPNNVGWLVQVIQLFVML